MDDFETKGAGRSVGRAVRNREEVFEEQSGLLAYLHDFAWLMAIVVIVFLFCFRIVIVSGPSMRDTLIDGDYLFLASKLFYHTPKQGDIIVASKDDFRGGEPIVKRIIATEGQTVDIDFVRGIVYVDGVPLDEPYTLTPTNLQEGAFFPMTIEENCVFVMGDNRNASTDSRSVMLGAVKKDYIQGKAVFLLVPGKTPDTEKMDWSRFGFIN